MTKLLICGATGVVGSRVLAIALSDPRVARVVAPTRLPVAAHVKLENPPFDRWIVQPQESRWQAESAVCALGTTRVRAGSPAAFRAVDFDLVLTVAQDARRSGVERFVLVSSVGADPRSYFLYTRTKGEVEAAVKQLAFPSLTIVRPGFLDQERVESRPFEDLVRLMLRIAEPVLPMSARASSVDRVSRLLIEAAVSAERGTHVIGPESLGREMHRLDK
ncbi:MULTISPECIES: NAD(P)H-binding protein [unclassified Bradyrhizobium]|uniref:NAD(P)H-binding protein n=1 Tax=unclassified Bradyrhizobium TaxID=2631580 RepID=UPI0024E0BED0|nr:MULTISPECIES: NAD(P)H-binding protein [unclassified Bradyrhizobium]